LLKLKGEVYASAVALKHGEWKWSTKQSWTEI